MTPKEREEERRKEGRKKERTKGRKEEAEKSAPPPLRREYKMGQPYENQLVRMLMWAGVQLRGRALA